MHVYKGLKRLSKKLETFEPTVASNESRVQTVLLGHYRYQNVTCKLDRVCGSCYCTRDPGVLLTIITEDRP